MQTQILLLSKEGEPVSSPIITERLTREFYSMKPFTETILQQILLFIQPFYKGKLGYGGKITDVHTSNTFDFYDVNGNTEVKDVNLSNTFSYDENVKALYVNYNRPLSKKTTLQAGVRMENTQSKGNLVSEISQPYQGVKRSYTNFFPSGALTYVLNAKN